jgi:hypothetical protein
VGWDSIQFESIQMWPGVLTKNRKRSRFDTSWTATVDLLDRELNALGARKVVCEMAISYTDLRNDGKIRASARPEHPGVILSFETKHGPLRYPCDTFDDWQDNIRAIALGLEALRKLDRYGITSRGEQYTGWKALPSGIEMPAHQMTLEEAMGFLVSWGEVGGNGGVDPSLFKNDLYPSMLYRQAAKRLHPDAPGGDAEKFKQLTEAWGLVKGA